MFAFRACDHYSCIMITLHGALNFTRRPISIQQTANNAKQISYLILSMHDNEELANLSPVNLL